MDISRVSLPLPCLHVCIVHYVCLSLTGANPGHSYTVKSPSSFSSSDVATESGTFGSSRCLKDKEKQRTENWSHGGIQTSHHNLQFTLIQTDRKVRREGRGREARRGLCLETLIAFFLCPFSNLNSW